MPFRPLGIFVYSYVLAGGFLDGRAGFHYAVSRGFYYWQIGLKMRERDRWSRRGDADGVRSPGRRAVVLGSELLACPACRGELEAARRKSSVRMRHRYDDRGRDSSAPRRAVRARAASGGVVRR